MDAISAGDVLVLIAYPVARVAVGVIAPHPVQIREDEGGINAEFVGIRHLRVTRLSVAQSPIVGPVALPLVPMVTF